MRLDIHDSSICALDEPLVDCGDNRFMSPHELQERILRVLVSDLVALIALFTCKRNCSSLIDLNVTVVTDVLSKCAS